MLKSKVLTDADGTKSVYMVFHPLDSSHTKEVQGPETNTKNRCFIRLIPCTQRKFRDRQQRTGVSSTWFLTHKGSPGTHNKEQVFHPLGSSYAKEVQGHTTNTKYMQVGT